MFLCDLCIVTLIATAFTQCLPPPPLTPSPSPPPPPPPPTPPDPAPADKKEMRRTPEVRTKVPVLFHGVDIAQEVIMQS